MKKGFEKGFKFGSHEIRSQHWHRLSNEINSFPTKILKLWSEIMKKHKQ